MVKAVAKTDGFELSRTITLKGRAKRLLSRAEYACIEGNLALTDLRRLCHFIVLLPILPPPLAARSL